MRTQVVRIRKGRPLGPQLEDAAELLRRGGLVAFPTETVYGLGANALDARAVARVFRAKGRPADNPVIVHIGRTGDLARVARVSNLRLARKFWPGPLTLLFPRHPRLPRAVTAGLPTVAVRMPAHPVALELIRRAGVPVAAPSANRSGRPSPTRARDVLEDLDGRIEMVVDGGPTPIGIESTVLTTLTTPPTLLRPGAVSREVLERVLGPIQLPPGAGDGPLPSPGLRHRHYSPRARVVLVEGRPAEVREEMEVLAGRFRSRGKSVAALVFSARPPRGVAARCLGRDPGSAARRLFAALRDLDREGPDVILVETFGRRGLGLALRDRLERAACGT